MPRWSQDFKVIRAIVGEGSVVSAPLEAEPWLSQADRFGGAPWAMPYFLAGNVIIYEDISGGTGTWSTFSLSAIVKIARPC